MNQGVKVMEVKKASSLVPMALAPVKMTIETTLAIKAYSSAVAPEVSADRSFTRDRAAWE
jgi:hypothetical protein